MPDISVIVTVHNAEKYLEECLDSVIEQTFSDIEILCMDGGSTDKSPLILQEYAKKDDRIRIINDSNTSYGHKINEGIRQSKGKYISVLESDDMYMPDMLERLWTVAEKYHPDFVNADYMEFWEIDGNRYQARQRMYPKQDYDCLLQSGKHPEDMRQILRYWTGIFRKDFLCGRDIRMNESPGASFQDMSFRFLTSALADTSYHIDAPVYLYRTDNPFSSMADTKKAEIIVDEFAFLKSDLERRGIDNPYIWRHFYTWKYNDLYGSLLRFSKDDRKGLLARCYNELKIEREYLEKNGGREYSDVTKKWLELSPDEFENDIEKEYDNLRTQAAKQRDFYRRLHGHKLVIFGCGVCGKAMLLSLDKVSERICCLTDNNQELWYGLLNGHDILPPDEAVKRYPDAFYIVANMFHFQEMEEQLQRLGIQEDYICHS